MRVEHIRADELAALHQGHGAHAVLLQAERVLVRGFGEVRVQPHPVAARQPGGFPHEVFRHGERAAGSEHELPHAQRVGVVEFPDDPLAVGQDRVRVLHHAVRGQAPVLPAQRHGAPRRRKAHPQLLRRLELARHEIPAPRGYRYR